MKMTRIKYTGRKDYKDRTAVRNEWTTGDEKLVTAANAKVLLKFAEFELADVGKKSTAKDAAKADEAEQSAVEAQVAEAEASASKEAKMTESVLMDVDSWDTPTLKEYAKKYDAKVDGRASITKQRASVATLIEQFGVR